MAPAALALTLDWRQLGAQYQKKCAQPHTPVRQRVLTSSRPSLVALIVAHRRVSFFSTNVRKAQQLLCKISGRLSPFAPQHCCSKTSYRYSSSCRQGHHGGNSVSAALPSNVPTIGALSTSRSNAPFAGTKNRQRRNSASPQCKLPY